MPFSSGFQNSIETILNFPSRQWLLTSLHERKRSIARFSHREIRLLSWELREEFETATSSVDSENSKYFKIAELAFVYFFYLVLVQTFFFPKIIIARSRILEDAFSWGALERKYIFQVFRWHQNSIGSQYKAKQSKKEYPFFCILTNRTVGWMSFKLS